jgi:hypothetical protein
VKAFERWHLTKDGVILTLEQYAASRVNNSESSTSDYKLWLEARFVGYSEGGQRSRFWIPYDGIAAGEKLDAWNAKYLDRVETALNERVHRDRVDLRTPKRALARFASVLPLLKSATDNEELETEAVGEMVSDGANTSSTKQRAYQAWDFQHMRGAKASERKDRVVETSDVAKSATASIGRPGTLAPSVIAPPRDMQMPESIEEAINCPAYGPQWRHALADEWAGLDCKSCYRSIKQEAFMKPLLSLKAIFKVKFNADGTLDKFKVRLVVGGSRDSTTTRRSRLYSR